MELLLVISMHARHDHSAYQTRYKFISCGQLQLIWNDNLEFLAICFGVESEAEGKPSPAKKAVQKSIAKKKAASSSDSSSSSSGSDDEGAKLDARYIAISTVRPPIY